MNRAMCGEEEQFRSGVIFTGAFGQDALSRGWKEGKMMDGMMWGMGAAGPVLAVLVAAALIKFLFFR